MAALSYGGMNRGGKVYIMCGVNGAEILRLDALLVATQC